MNPQTKQMQRSANCRSAPEHEASSIPDSWLWTRVGDICETYAGYGFPKHMQGKKRGDLPFYKVTDISNAWQRNEKYLIQSNHQLTLKEARSINANPLPVHTTVFAKIGAAIALNRRAMLSTPSLVDNNVMGVWPIQNGIDAHLLFYFTWTIELAHVARATTVPSVRKDDVESVRIPLPPLPEQHRIVAEIEKQFTRLDASVAALKRAQANLKRYRASVLKSVCEGKLVPTEADLARAEGRDYEPAGQLLERILAERRAHWESQENRRGKYKEPAEPDTSELLELPMGWAWTTVEQLMVRSEYGTSVKCSYEAEGSPVLRIPNIVAGEIDLRDIKYSTKPVPIDSQSALQVGDVLMCRTNGSITLIGKTAVVGAELDPYHGFASYLLRFRFAETQMLPQWFHSFATSQHGRSYIEQHAASSAGQHNVSLT